jgi:hypothetical protein
MQKERTYEICLEDTLDEKWASFFSPFTLIRSSETTILVGNVHDQAELFGVLLKIRDSGLTLISIHPLPR